MNRSITVTEAKVKLSEFVNHVVSTREKIYISKKGKNVAVLVPLDELDDHREEGLILAKSVLVVGVSHFLYRRFLPVPG